ncbi:MAG: hypothetical protein WCP66_10265 [Methylococcales bacterium]
MHLSLQIELMTQVYVRSTIACQPYVAIVSGMVISVNSSNTYALKINE